jgi:protein SCO1/2
MVSAPAPSPSGGAQLPPTPRASVPPSVAAGGRRPVWLRPELWLVLAALAVALPVFLVSMRRAKAERPPLPKLGHVVPFSLVRESGATLSSADLAGKVWVADFVFLGCTESCPMLTGRMSNLQRRLAEEEERLGGSLPVRLVSFTVDPTNDTTARLAEYATRWGANPKRWAFATGSTADIQHVVADGFKVAYGKTDDGAGAFEIMHGNWFVLVDDENTIRGYYSTDRPEEMASLTADILSLAKKVQAR